MRIRTRRRLGAGVAAATLAATVWAGAAGAATPTTTVDFTGTVSSTMNVNDGVTVGSIAAGTKYTGTVVYDQGQRPLHAPYGGGTFTAYRFMSMTFTIGASTATSGPGSIAVFDNVVTSSGYPGGDSVYVNFTGSSPNSSGVAPTGRLSGLDFNWMGLAFLDPSGQAVTSGNLPDLSSPAFSTRFSEFNFGSWGTPFGAGNTSMIQTIDTVGTTGGPVVDIAFAPSLPNGTVGSPYQADIGVATGGSGSFTYAATGLPDGLALTGGLVEGTPVAAGTYDVTLTATDSTGSAVTVTLPLTVDTPAICSGSSGVITAYVARNPGFIVVNGGLNLLDHLWTTNLDATTTTFLGGLVNWYRTGLVVSWSGTADPLGCVLDHLTVMPAVTVATTSLPGATATQPYTADVAAAWGAAPVALSVSGLPAGLGFDGATITGTPTVVGTFPIGITAVDANGATATVTLPLVVAAPPITFAPTLGAGTVGVPYLANVSAVGYGPFTFGATGLPAGLSISGSSISGVPTTAGSAVVQLSATDAAGNTATAQVTLTIAPAASTGNYTIADEGKGRITGLGPSVIVVGSKKLIWNSSTSITVHVGDRVLHVVDGSVKVGMKVEWKGKRDRATNAVLTSRLEIG